MSGAREVEQISAEYVALERKQDPTTADSRRLRDLARDVVRAYRDGAGRTVPEDLARRALRTLGADADPPPFSLRDYDHDTYGPYLGISDEGSAADAIVRAAGSTPKARVIGTASPLNLGVALDLEWLGAAGELPVGPDEYAHVWLRCTGRILTSTNVGTRVNLRYYLPAPTIAVGTGAADDEAGRAVQTTISAFKPFLAQPGATARPFTVFIEFTPGRTVAQRRQILKRIALKVQDARQAGSVDPERHRLGLSVRIGWDKRGEKTAAAAIDLAADVGFEEVSIDGVVRKRADEGGPLPGLLQYLPQGCIGRLLRRAGNRGIAVRPRMRVDPHTVARSIWGPLYGARCMGLHLGKYSVFPLTLEDAQTVVEQIQEWFGDWSAAPVFFVEQGLLTADKVYLDHDRVKGLEIWLASMSERKVRVVLIDTVEKSKGWRLLRLGRDPKGLIGPQQLSRLVDIANELGIKALWAGGITLPQAYEFSRLGVFGLYVTTAVAAQGPVSGAYARDPMLAYQREPTFEGVRRLKLLMEAGFLETRPALANRAGEIAARVSDLLAALAVANASNERIAAAEQALEAVTEEAWRAHLPPAAQSLRGAPALG